MTMYDHLRQKGIDMSWYDRAKQKAGLPNVHNTPLHDHECAYLSIYLLKKDGTLWTLSLTEPHSLVRQTGKKLAENVYICVHCKQTFDEVGKAHSHYKKKEG